MAIRWVSITPPPISGKASRRVSTTMRLVPPSRQCAQPARALSIRPANTAQRRERATGRPKSRHGSLTIQTMKMGDARPRTRAPKARAQTRPARRTQATPDAGSSRPAPHKHIPTADAPRAGEESDHDPHSVRKHPTRASGALHKATGPPESACKSAAAHEHHKARDRKRTKSSTGIPER